jgi:hypothetical protein
VAFECANTLATRLVYGPEPRPGGNLPHLDRLVETATDQTVARWSKSHTVDTVLVTLFALETHNEISARNVPHADAFVKRSGSNETVVRRNGNGSNSVFYREVGDLLVSLEIPQTDASVTTARGNDLAVAGEVEGVNVLLVAGELVLNLAAVDIPDL